MWSFRFKAVWSLLATPSREPREASTKIHQSLLKAGITKDHVRALAKTAQDWRRRTGQVWEPVIKNIGFMKPCFPGIAICKKNRGLAWKRWTARTNASLCIKTPEEKTASWENQKYLPELNRLKVLRYPGSYYRKYDRVNSMSINFSWWKQNLILD